MSNNENLIPVGNDWDDPAVQAALRELRNRRLAEKARVAGNTVMDAASSINDITAQLRGKEDFLRQLIVRAGYVLTALKNMQAVHVGHVNDAEELSGTLGALNRDRDAAEAELREAYAQLTGSGSQNINSDLSDELRALGFDMRTFSASEPNVEIQEILNHFGMASTPQRSYPQDFREQLSLNLTELFPEQIVQEIRAAADESNRLLQLQLSKALSRNQELEGDIDRLGKENRRLVVQLAEVDAWREQYAQAYVICRTQLQPWQVRATDKALTEKGFDVGYEPSLLDKVLAAFKPGKKIPAEIVAAEPQAIEPDAYTNESTSDDVAGNFPYPWNEDEEEVAVE